MAMKDPIFLALSSAFGLALGSAVLYALWRRKRQGRWVEVATVDKLFVHPIKSCRGIQVDKFQCAEKAIMLEDSEIGDRCFMIVFGDCVTATIRQFHNMVLISPTVIGRDRIRLDAPGMQPLEMNVPDPNDENIEPTDYKVRGGTVCPGIDCGDEVAEWLEKFMGAGNTRLIFHNKKWSHRERDKLVGFGHLGVYAKPLKSVFQDYDAFNVMSQASLDMLNEKLGADHQVNERYFRTNVVVKGCNAFAEDNWKRIRIGSSEFQFAKQTTRCHVTTVDPETGIKDQELVTLNTLSTFRKATLEEKPLYGTSPKFAVDFVVIKEGKVHVGDKVLMYIDN